jgi:hypothetical protein
MTQSWLTKALPRPNLALKAAISVILSLGTWWFLLKGLSALLFQRIAYVPLLFLIAPNGLSPIEVNSQTSEWIFNVELNYDGTNPQTGEPLLIDSVEFAVKAKLVEVFIAGWFTYIGLALFAGVLSRTQWPRILRGFGIQVALSVLALTLYVYVNALASVADATGGSAMLLGVLKLCSYLVMPVLSSAGPFAVVLIAIPQWRNYFAIADSPPNKLQR